MEEKEVLSAGQLRAELRRERYKSRYFKLLRSTLSVLVIVAAVSVLIATLILPVLQIYGDSMTPTLSEKEIVLCVKSRKFKQGEIVSFYYNNRILIKRVIATEGQCVDIDDKGNVTVDGQLLDEPYLIEKSRGDCDIDLPYVVPANSYFVLGDHRVTSVDSRNSAIGCIDSEEIIGRLAFTVWPLSKIGAVK